MIQVAPRLSSKIFTIFCAVSKLSSVDPVNVTASVFYSKREEHEYKNKKDDKILGLFAWFKSPVQIFDSCAL